MMTLPKLAFPEANRRWPAVLPLLRQSPAGDWITFPFGGPLAADAGLDRGFVTHQSQCLRVGVAAE